RQVTNEGQEQMNISRFFVDKPIFAAVLSVLVFVAGLISIFALPISEYPEVVPPSVVVRAQYPGANPKVIAETVATPIEQEINGVENMLYMTSQNTSDGALQLTVTFKIGTDVEQAETQVQVAAGVVGQGPSKDADFQLTVNTQGRLSSVEEFGDIVVATNADGATTRLKDVARLEMGSNSYALRALLDNKSAVAIPIFQSPTANALQLSSDVRAKMAELS